MNDRIERAVGVVGRALVLQPDVIVGNDALAQVLHDARLADARLAGKQDDLPLAARRPLAPRAQRTRRPGPCAPAPPDHRPPSRPRVALPPPQAPAKPPQPPGSRPPGAA